MNHPITIKSGDVQLSGVLQYPESDKVERGTKKYPIVVICHGFVGNRIGTDRLFVEAAEQLTNSGYLVLRFDYGGCGESTGDYGSGGLDKLIEQTRTVLDYTAGLDLVDPDRIILLGHSLGGAVAVLTAARDSRVKSLVLWAPVAHPYMDIRNIIGKQAVEEIEKTGKSDYLHYELTQHFTNSLAEYQPLTELRSYNGDVLIVHGTADTVVPVDYCFLYQKTFWLRKEGCCDKEVIMQADHTFSSKSTRDQAFDVTLRWIDSLGKRRSDWSYWTI
ncbi:alpha/beta hydrolase family protein [Paenibacillus mendelii]|uniref:Alpha/beta hydrolase family protein n=1 Tax=Paenibacillus mendelii TaxID=206163 RepID=A0ABV6J3R0_9BACL|nr:alpha/beta fold hydrolase [Paenibacillus mendelii]MCQ6561971.1 alpha/beta fold hydrolase [Paenibacillus mendelii]